MSDTTPGAREDLLRELALRLSTYPGDPRNDNPQLLVGQLPDNMAIPVPMPENTRILGTLIRSPENINIILDSNMSPAEVANFYKEQLGSSGWNELDMMRPMYGGFVHSRFQAFENQLTFCQGPDGPAFTVHTFERQQSQTEIRLDINFGTEFSPCAQSNQRMQQMHRGLHDLIPPLLPPTGAKQFGGGGSGGGAGSWHTTASLETDLDLATLLTHYSQQLEKGGWTRTGEGFSGPLAWTTWAFQDEDKENWSGLFFILKMPGKEREHALEVRIDWDKKAQRHGGWFSYAPLG